MAQYRAKVISLARFHDVGQAHTMAPGQLVPFPEPAVKVGSSRRPRSN
jgi:hypothetical protein